MVQAGNLLLINIKRIVRNDELFIYIFNFGLGTFTEAQNKFAQSKTSTRNDSFEIFFTVLSVTDTNSVTVEPSCESTATCAG